MNMFFDANAVSRYAEGAVRNVPCYHAMQHMTQLLLQEHVPAEGQVLVLGAGGGLELKKFAEAQPHWVFEGIDPSKAMLDLAAQTLGDLGTRVTLRQGTIHDASQQLFDGATCLLTMHFLGVEERHETLTAIRRRLKPGAPFVSAHFSIPQDGRREVWLGRFAAWANIKPEQAAANDSRLSVLSPEQDESLLREAGFSNVALFYAGFTFRGWVGYA